MQIDLLEIRKKYKFGQKESLISEIQNDIPYVQKSHCFRAQRKSFGGFEDFLANLPAKVSTKKSLTMESFNDSWADILDAGDESFGEGAVYKRLKEEISTLKLSSWFNNEYETWLIDRFYSPGEDEVYTYIITGETKKFYFYLEYSGYIIH